MRSICLDTHTYAALLTGQADALAIIGTADQVWMPAPVLGELRTGFLKGRKAAANELVLQDFLASPHVRVAPVDEAVSRSYAQVFDQLRKIGKPIPTNDLWIAACALHIACPLYSLDRHFQLVDGIDLVHDLEQWRATA